MTDALARTVPVPYQLRRVRRVVGRGVSQASFCDLAAILKVDTAESQFTTYNELVAVRLAQAAGFPVADGILTVGPTGHAFASLQIGVPGLSLPDLNPGAVSRAADRYRREAAQLFVFDAWIGNGDRFANMKAALAYPHVHVFAGFDHGQTLLGCRRTKEESLAALKSQEPFVEQHPFTGCLRKTDIDPALAELLAVPRTRVQQACVVGTPLSQVPPEEQAALADALLLRRRRLRRILGRLRLGPKP